MPNVEALMSLVNKFGQAIYEGRIRGAAGPEWDAIDTALRAALAPSAAMNQCIGALELAVMHTQSVLTTPGPSCYEVADAAKTALAALRAERTTP